jgi:hypothetical protein
VLRKFAIEIVKIDRAFINNLEAEEGMNRAIVEAIIHVGHSLAMSTVAEGIETAQQAAILREFGADVGQGYFFAPPLRGDEAHQLATAEPRPIFSVGPGRESSETAAKVQHPFTVVPGGQEPVETPRMAPAEAPVAAAATPAPAAPRDAGIEGVFEPSIPGAGVTTPGVPANGVGTTAVPEPSNQGAGVLEPIVPPQGAPAHSPGFPVAPATAPAAADSATFSPLTGDNEMQAPGGNGALAARSGPLALNLDIGVLGLNGSVTADVGQPQGSDRTGEPGETPRQTPGEVA